MTTQDNLTSPTRSQRIRRKAGLVFRGAAIAGFITLWWWAFFGISERVGTAIGLSAGTLAFGAGVTWLVLLLEEYV